MILLMVLHIDEGKQTKKNSLIQIPHAVIRHHLFY